MGKHHAFTEAHVRFDPWQDSLDALADRFYSLTGPLMTRAEYLAQANAINAKWRGRTYMHEAASVRAQMGEGQA